MPWQFYPALVCSLGAFVTASLRIRADATGDVDTTYILRPLTMVLIALVAMMAPAPVSVFYKGALVLALLLAILGESIMMIRGTPTMVGVIFLSFIALLYLFAFSSQLAWGRPTPWALLFLPAVAALYWIFRAHLGEFWFPALALMVILILATWMALEQFVRDPALWSTAAFAGMLSIDGAAVILGLRTFRMGFRWDAHVMAGLYYLGQWLIAVSIWGGVRMPLIG